MAASSEELADYTFTVRGHAYPIDDVFKQRDIPQFFTTKKLSSVSWKERTKSTPPAINTEAEKKTPGPDESQVIFVWLFPSNANEETLTKKLASVKGRVGYALPRDAAFVVQPTQGSPAFRVVTMNKSAIPVGGMKYYVLMEKDHQTDLWYGFTIPQELVFFFPEYRHPSTKLVERTKDWTQKVLASCKTGSDTRGQSVSHCTYMGTQNEQNLARLHIELAKFHLTQDPSALDVIKNIVDKNDHSKTQLKSLILLFLDIDGDFNEEHAVALDTEIK